ncbi:unnamed protein product [Allacma fusca]|uniref:Uncharacterized protein n=1 Tax=Allacma fusca TaxID=39272 RepID=A0A8J2JEY1_9HEXA|nr:unnamed protein product [Allacma fusca]
MRFQGKEGNKSIVISPHEISISTSTSVSTFLLHHLIAMEVLHSKVVLESRTLRIASMGVGSSKTWLLRIALGFCINGKFTLTCMWKISCN